jgi:aminoglycoside phosphotransferase (APT) family kinase protein
LTSPPHAARVTAEKLAPIVRHLTNSAHVVEIAHLADGIANTSYRLRLSDDTLVVLRLYERAAAACRKELALYTLLRGAVPIPEVLHAEPNGGDGIGPYALLRFVEGITLRELKRAGGAGAVAEAAYSCGQTLAAFGRFEFGRSGWLEAGDGGLDVGAPLMDDAAGDQLPRFVDRCLTSESAERRLGATRIERVSRHVWSWAERLGTLPDETRLVHCDYGNRNIVVREDAGVWRVAAVLDWEFAIAATPLIDVGHFLRYDRPGRPRLEPHFARGFLERGGSLPDEWQGLVRVLDLSALVELLAREQLPGDLIPELMELVMATVEERDLTD